MRKYFIHSVKWFDIKAVLLFNKVFLYPYLISLGKYVDKTNLCCNMPLPFLVFFYNLKIIIYFPLWLYVNQWLKLLWVRITWRACETDCWAPPQNVLFIRSGWGLSPGISNKCPKDATIEGLQITQWEPTI